MNTMKKALFFIGLTLFSIGIYAQSVDEAGMKYNEGNQAFNSKDYAGAVVSYTKALQIAEQAGPDADDLKAKIEKQLTTSYLKNGLSTYKKDIDGAIAILEKGLSFAQSNNDKSSAKKFKSALAQIRVKKADKLRGENKLDEAYAEYEMALEMKPDYPKSLYGEGMVFKEKGDIDKMMEKMDLVIKNGESNTKMAKVVAAAKANAARALLAKAADELNNQKFTNAVKYIDLSVKYGPFDEGTMDIFNQIATQAKDIPETADAISKARAALN